MDGVSHSEGTWHSAWCREMSLPVAPTTGPIGSAMCWRHPDSPRSSSLTCKHVCSRASPGVHPSPWPGKSSGPGHGSWDWTTAMGAVPFCHSQKCWTRPVTAAPEVAGGISGFWFLMSNKQEEHRIFFPTSLV